MPEYRGGSPLNWQMINGENYIGISVIKMTKGLDSGPIYEKAKFKLKDKYNISDVHKRANKIFSKLTRKTINKILKNKKPVPQSLKKVKIYKQRSDDDGLIEWKNLKQTKFIILLELFLNLIQGLTFLGKERK